MPGRRYTISGVDHLIRLLNQYPQLMALSSLVPILEVGKKARQAIDRTGCNCTASKVYADNKLLMEQSLANLCNGDHLVAKSILNVDEICYYVKDVQGKMSLRCI
jgi:hypothetical protein